MLTIRATKDTLDQILTGAVNSVRVTLDDTVEVKPGDTVVFRCGRESASIVAKTVTLYDARVLDQTTIEWEAGSAKPAE